MEKPDSQSLGRDRGSRGDQKESSWALVQFGGDSVEVGCCNSALEYLGLKGDGLQVSVSCGKQCTLPTVQDSAPKGSLKAISSLVAS